MENIVSAAKTDVFRVRINPEIKQELESVYAKNGLTLTDAINVFFQQSLNAGVQHPPDDRHCGVGTVGCFRCGRHRR